MLGADVGDFENEASGNEILNELSAAVWSGSASSFQLLWLTGQVRRVRGAPTKGGAMPVAPSQAVASPATAIVIGLDSGSGPPLRMGHSRARIWSTAHGPDSELASTSDGRRWVTSGPSAGVRLAPNDRGCSGMDAEVSPTRHLLLSVDGWTPVGSPRPEARWFVEGDIPRRFRPRTSPVERVDAYHVPSLTPDRAVKRRGPKAKLEYKVRAHAEPVRLGDIDGCAERWQKWRSRGRHDFELAGPWVLIAKQIWSFEGCEVARVITDTTTWWSLSVVIGASQRELGSRARRWLSRLDSDAQPDSYAGWLHQHCETARS